MIHHGHMVGRRHRMLAWAALIPTAVLAVQIAGPAQAQAQAPLLAVPAIRPADESQAAEQRMATLLDKRIGNKILGKDVSMVVLDAESGRVIFDQDGSQSQLPASTMKIVTAVTTLASFDPEDSFTTRVLSGRSTNDIVLRCGGDPMLTGADLRSLARQTARSLPRGASVTLFVDDTMFGGPPRAPGWPDDYIPSVAARVSCLAQLGDYSATPSRNAARTFAKALRNQGVKARLGGSGVAPANAKVLAQTSHTVRQAVDRMLLESENNIAEVLFRQVAVARGLPGTWGGGRRAARAVLGELGLDTSGTRLLDGSGLSRRDRVSARFLAEVLRLTRTDPRFTTMYDANAMPRAGMTGTLAASYGRFNTSPSSCAKGRIRAKTGTLFDTIGLAGVATGEDGKDKVFAILVNDRPRRFIALTTRRAVDKVAATITGCW